MWIIKLQRVRACMITWAVAAGCVATVAASMMLDSDQEFEPLESELCYVIIG